MELSISLAQMEFDFGKVNSNLARAKRWVIEASERGSDLILLPELWASGYDLENWRRYATPLDGGIFAELSHLANEFNIAIGSSLLEECDGEAFNTFVLYGNDGDAWGIYRKVHRFRLLEEEKWLAAGDHLVLARTPWGDVGLSICYDLRFPELFRPYALAGARLSLIVAEWPERRIVHWSKLLQARAIENQMFIVGVNKVGKSRGVKLGGRSAVIDPWGVPITEGGDTEVLLTATIVLQESDNARKHIPALKDLAPNAYKIGPESHFYNGE
jgi:omega-amidase